MIADQKLIGSSGLIRGTGVQAQRTNVFCKDRVTAGIAGGFPEGFDKTFAVTNKLQES